MAERDPAALIEDPRDLPATLEAGCKPKGEWAIGTEHEKFGFCREDFTPLAFDGPRGIEAILISLQDQFDWAPVREGGRIIGLKKDGASVSLEPGGQFELSGAPLTHIHQTCNEVHTHLAQIREICDPLNIGFIGLGMTPTWKREDIHIMPKPRYDIMRPYMAKKGSLGLDMMLRTSTVQVNLDFSSEADMVKKFQTSLALQSVATALFANSPFTEGKPNGFLSFRSHVWTDTDPDRTGLMHFVFEDGFSFERYVDYALDVPMYFIKRDGEYVNCAGESFRAFLEGKLPQRPGEKPTFKDWEDHLTTIFPEVRMKTFLEMRGADSGPWSRICALPALWVGLLYEQASLDAAADLCKGWTKEDRIALHEGAKRAGLKAKFRGGTVQDLAAEMLAIARQGLKARARLDTVGQDESGFLAPLQESVDTGETPAEILLKRYEGEWDGDASRAFADFAY